MHTRHSSYLASCTTISQHSADPAHASADHSQHSNKNSISPHDQGQKPSSSTQRRRNTAVSCDKKADRYKHPPHPHPAKTPFPKTQTPAPTPAKTAEHARPMPAPHPALSPPSPASKNRNCKDSSRSPAPDP